MTMARSKTSAAKGEWCNRALVVGGRVATGSATAMRATIVLARGCEAK